MKKILIFTMIFVGMAVFFFLLAQILFWLLVSAAQDGFVAVTVVDPLATDPGWVE
jgi:hypothetical protein